LSADDIVASSDDEDDDEDYDPDNDDYWKKVVVSCIFMLNIFIRCDFNHNKFASLASVICDNCCRD